jgi:hypothetical protein
LTSIKATRGARAEHRSSRYLAGNDTGRKTMAEQASTENKPEERVPALQQMLDNPFLLLFLGVALPTVLYIVWGVMEIVTVPITPLAK